MIDITKQNINDYLHFGYIPEFAQESRLTHILNPPKEMESLENLNEKDLIEQGEVILNEVFDELIKDKLNKKNIVPLSGGLDSRLILAALAKRMDGHNIEAITFGSPRTFDFDLPNKVVSKLGIKHKKVSCISLDYSTDKLISACINGGMWTSTPDNYINRLSLCQNEETFNWTGFMGGEIAGEYSILGNDIDDVENLFVKYQKRSKLINLTEKDYDPTSSLNEVSSIPYNLTEFELLFLANRSAAGAIPIMYPNKTNVISPFLHPLWVNFIIRVPKKFRLGASLYKKIIFKMFPEIMSLPCKNNLGLGLGNDNRGHNFFNHLRLKFRYELSKKVDNVKYPPIGANYLHYKVAIKSIPSLNTAIKESCNNLEKRGIVPWISPNDILFHHMNKGVDNSTPLLMLLGLEVNLRAHDKLSDN